MVETLLVMQYNAHFYKHFIHALNNPYSIGFIVYGTGQVNMIPGFCKSRERNLHDDDMEATMM